MTQISAGNWQLVSVSDPCGVSMQDTGANVRTVIVSAPGPQGPSGVGSGGLALSGLSDVSIGNTSSGDLLSYDAGSSTWKNEPRSQVTDGGNF